MFSIFICCFHFHFLFLLFFIYFLFSNICKQMQPTYNFYLTIREKKRRIERKKKQYHPLRNNSRKITFQTNETTSYDQRIILFEKVKKKHEIFFNRSQSHKIILYNNIKLTQKFEGDHNISGSPLLITLPLQLVFLNLISYTVDHFQSEAWIVHQILPMIDNIDAQLYIW